MSASLSALRVAHPGSIADGIIRMEMEENARIVTVVKYPQLAPGRTETPITWSPTVSRESFDPRVLAGEMGELFSASAEPLRAKLQDDTISVFWKNLASWSGMLWDPKRFPGMVHFVPAGAEKLVDKLGHTFG